MCLCINSSIMLSIAPKKIILRAARHYRRSVVWIHVTLGVSYLDDGGSLQM